MNESVTLADRRWSPASASDFKPKAGRERILFVPPALRLLERLMRVLSCTLLLLTSLAARAAEIKGKVTNAVGGEALGQVESRCCGRNTPSSPPAGEFTISNLPPGNYRLRLNSVSYRLLTIPFTLATDADIKEFSITLVPDNFHHSDKVEVRGDLFQVSDSPATTEMNLTSSEDSRNLTHFRMIRFARCRPCRAFQPKGTTSSLPSSQ